MGRLPWVRLKWGSVPVALAYGLALMLRPSLETLPSCGYPHEVSVALNPSLCALGDSGALLKRACQLSGPTTPRHAPTQDLVLRVQQGDTLMGLLTKAGVGCEEAHAAVGALKGLTKPSDLQIGQEIKVRLIWNPKAQRYRLETFSLSPDLGTDVLVRCSGGACAFEASKNQRVLNEMRVAVQGSITNSLYYDALKQGVPPQLLHKIVNVLAHKFDLQRDFQKGDEFQIFFQEVQDPQTGWRQAKTCLFVAVTVGGKPYRIYQFQPPGSKVPEFYTEKGESLKSSFLRTPIDGARLTSGFGMRRHPILGFSKMHKGVDFCAPTGTLVMAAGSGIVTFAGRMGAYGNLIKIRHPGGVETRYAHLKTIHVRPGQHVPQGHRVGLVGTTGRTTGPHLHFEFLKNGTQVDPKKMGALPAPSLQGGVLKAFVQHKAQMDRSYLAQLPSSSGKVRL